MEKEEEEVLSMFRFISDYRKGLLIVYLERLVLDEVLQKKHKSLEIVDSVVSRKLIEYTKGEQNER